jgi:putative ABC transport system permease protein
VSSAFVEQRLLKIWDSVTSENAPNFFLLNIQPDQKIEIGKFLEGLVGNHSLYPMVRGRLIAINGNNVDKSKYESIRAKRLISREMNISYGNIVPEYNQITSGKNFSGGLTELSVEQDIAKTLGIKLTDLITFDVGGEQLTLEVTSLRKVKWESMEVNFFMFASPDKLQDKPQTFITAFHYNWRQNGSGFANIQKLILEKFPNVTVVDTSIIVGQVQKVLKDAVNIIKLFFSFSVVAAFLVLWSSLLALKEEREREIALLRILGCSKQLLISAQIIELVFIGALAGSVGSVFAQLFGNIIFYTIFAEIGFDFSWMYVIVGVAIAIVVSILAGSYGLFRISRNSSVTNLRTLPQ